MNIREFRDTVEFNIEHNLKHSILGLGAPGVGKSHIIREIGAKYGYTVIDIRLAQMSEVEIGGLIYPNAEKTRTIWLAPEILPNEERDGKKTILLLDEITSCTKRVQVAAYQLILDRKIGQYTLPEGTVVIALGNRKDDDGVYIHLAGPLADRFEIHYIEPDFQIWLVDFALKYGVHPFVIDYLTYKPEDLHTQNPDSEEMVFATPRSWERVSDILNIDSDVTKPVIRNKIIGNVGMAAGLQFIRFCKEHQNDMDIEEVLNGETKYPREPEKLRILTTRIVNQANFLTRQIRPLTDEEILRVQAVILALVRLPEAEYSIMGLKQLLELNRSKVQEIFNSMSNREVDRFVEKNWRAIGLDNEGKTVGNSIVNWLSHLGK